MGKNAKSSPNNVALKVAATSIIYPMSVLTIIYTSPFTGLANGLNVIFAWPIIIIIWIGIFLIWTPWALKLLKKNNWPDSEGTPYIDQYFTSSL
jgi:hypothetical protein